MDVGAEIEGIDVSDRSNHDFNALTRMQGRIEELQGEIKELRKRKRELAKKQGTERKPEQPKKTKAAAAAKTDKGKGKAKAVEETEAEMIEKLKAMFTTRGRTEGKRMENLRVTSPDLPEGLGQLLEPGEVAWLNGEASMIMTMNAAGERTRRKRFRSRALARSFNTCFETLKFGKIEGVDFEFGDESTDSEEDNSAEDWLD